jgi:4-amino-4-deoxy-L-arabinose transferase-like glycosyltransferase
MVNLTDKQIELIEAYKFPLFYSFFFKMWEKFLRYVMMVCMVATIILIVIAQVSYLEIFFIAGTTLFFTCFSIGLLALIANQIKQWSIKRYAKKIGLTIEEWNDATFGLTLGD